MHPSILISALSCPYSSPSPSHHSVHACPLSTCLTDATRSYGGETLPTDIVLRGPEGWGEIDVPGFAAKNSRAIREPEILACAQVLRSQYARVGAVGFCFGGWACCRLAAEKAEDGRPLVDCVATAHPSWVTRADIDGISVPVLLMVPQTDHQFGEELRAYAFESLSRKAAVFDYALFPGVVHGFATRGNPKDVVEQKAMVRAKSLAVAWVKHWLHEAED